MLIAGQSAGGGLALQVAYGLGDGTVTSSCGGAVPQPKAVFALYPPDDLAMAWNLDTGLSAVSSRVFNTGYLGGSPEQFPERYRVTSPVFHVRTGLPPTLIAAGAVDHLVPIAGHAEMVVKLHTAGVPNAWLSVPYGEHGYDLVWGGLGGQITRKVVRRFPGAIPACSGLISLSRDTREGRRLPGLPSCRPPLLVSTSFPSTE